MNIKSRSIIKKILKEINKCTEELIHRHPSTYAYEQADFLQKLNLGRFKCAKKYLEAHDEEFQNQLNIFQKTSAAATYSPHRPLMDSPYFVATETLDELDILLPGKNKTIKSSHVVHIGQKGSGKTTLQNQWLSINHEKLEEKDVFYVRCDAPKIFEFWEKNTIDVGSWPTDSLPTVEEYLDFQTLYILAKYSDKGMPKRIVSRMDEEKLTFDFKEARAIDSPLRSSKEVSWYLREHIARNIKIFEVGNPEKSYLRDVLFSDKPTKRREYFRWKECSNKVNDWFLENGVIYLRILDGVDNLHINTDIGREISHAFLPEILKFILRSSPINQIRFVVMRNRTWVELLNSDPITLGSPSIISPRVIYHIPPESQEVAEKRISWMKNIVGDTDCTRTLEAAVNALPSGKIMNNNMRTLIESATSLAEQVRFRYHQLGGQIDIKRQAIIQMKRNLFLNGRFYLSTQNEFAYMNREKGLLYINPFWFPDDFTLKSDDRDPLFIRIRLLELLYSGDIIKDDLISYLVNGFLYKKENVIIAIGDAKAFGWIDVKSEYLGTSHITYCLTEAGKYFLTDLLCDVDVLYMLALDTRLPCKFFSKGFIQVHTNHIHQRSGYIGAAALTVMTFICYLLKCLKCDFEKINMQALNGSYTQYFLSKKSIWKINKKFCKIMKNAESDDWDLISSKCNSVS